MTEQATSDAPVRYEVRDAVATITLNRPEGMNGLDTPTKEALLAAVTRAATDGEARVVVLTGSGRAFCVGQDLKEHREGLANGDELSGTVTQHYNPTVHALATMDKPVIAAINGVAAGAGVSLALACDLRIINAKAGLNMAFSGIALSC
ncbi:MAG: enoyl-CoA hydratase/isomerase family protein, partial [Myxococcales bacterium]